MDFVFIGTGIAIGFLAGWVLFRLRGNIAQQLRLKELEVMRENGTAENARLQKELEGKNESLARQAGELRAASDQAARAESRVAELQASIAELGARIEAREKEIRELGEMLTAQKESVAGMSAKIRESELSMAEQKRLLGEAEARLSDVFRSLAGEALKSSSSEFLKLAQERLSAVSAEAKGDLDLRKEEIARLVQPITDSLQRYQEQIGAIESKRENAYGTISEMIRSVTETQSRLQAETQNLVNALRMPQVKGRWGEITLQRVVELAGMSEYCDFEQQVSQKTEEGRLRPDMIVRLPNERLVVVDAKVSLGAYLDANAEGLDENARAQLYSRHAAQVRSHVNDLSSKSYWSQFQPSPDFVIMFLPGDPFLSAALNNDRSLIEDAIANRVLLATPTTLVAILRAVAYGWKQVQLTENAQKIADEGRMLFERLSVFYGYMEDVRKSLEKAVESFNRAGKSWDSRVLPSARRFQELGAAAPDREVDVLDAIEHVPHAFIEPEKES